jgi:hypothetical protein
MAPYGVVELLADVEAELEWRTAEALAIKRTVAEANDPAVALSLRRAQIALLYAHAEGGVKRILTCYVRAINALALRAEECNEHLVASAWEQLFRELNDTQAKHGGYFKTSVPDSPKLHRFVRHAEFVVRHRDFASRTVVIDEEKIVDTESNIDQSVLSSILYRLGFPRDYDPRSFSDLQYLRALRNEIAHGERSVATPAQCEKYHKVVFLVLTRLRDLVARALTQGTFRRTAA